MGKKLTLKRYECNICTTKVDMIFENEVYNRSGPRFCPVCGKSSEAEEEFHDDEVYQYFYDKYYGEKQ